MGHSVVWGDDKRTSQFLYYPEYRSHEDIPIEDIASPLSGVSAQSYNAIQCGLMIAAAKEVLDTDGVLTVMGAEFPVDPS